MPKTWHARSQHCADHRPRAGRRIIVADDGSGPEHVAALRRIAGIEVIEGPENAGFAANVNRGIARHRPDGTTWSC